MCTFLFVVFQRKELFIKFLYGCTTTCTMIGLDMNCEFYLYSLVFNGHTRDCLALLRSSLPSVFTQRLKLATSNLACSWGLLSSIITSHPEKKWPWLWARETPEYLVFPFNIFAKAALPSQLLVNSVSNNENCIVGLNGDNIANSECIHTRFQVQDQAWNKSNFLLSSPAAVRRRIATKVCTHIHRVRKKKRPRYFRL